MSGTRFESVQCVKDLSVTVTSSLKFSQQCKDVAGKANRMLGFIKRNFYLYISFVRRHLEYTVQFGAPHHAKDITN